MNCFHQYRIPSILLSRIQQPNSSFLSTQINRKVIEWDTLTGTCFIPFSTHALVCSFNLCFLSLFSLCFIPLSLIDTLNYDKSLSNRAIQWTITKRSLQTNNEERRNPVSQEPQVHFFVLSFFSTLIFLFWGLKWAQQFPWLFQNRSSTHMTHWNTQFYLRIQK